MDHPECILLVEDNPMDTELALLAFRKAHVETPVHTASTGEVALDYMHGRGIYADREAFPLPRVVLLDLKLPGISGFDVLHDLKTTPYLRRVPVVVLTSSREERDRTRTYDEGANSHVVKPMASEQMVELGSVMLTGYFANERTNPIGEPLIVEERHRVTDPA